MRRSLLTLVAIHLLACTDRERAPSADERAALSSGDSAAERAAVSPRVPAAASPRVPAAASPGDSAAASAAAIRTDDFGDLVSAATRPQRIVSLNPSTTELLFALGAGSRLVGRTEWDLVPDSARFVPDLGDGIRPNLEAVLATRPDLVVLYASADNRAAARTLRAAGVTTLALKIDRIADFRRAARLLGAATGESARAETVVDSVDRTLDRVRAATAGRPRPEVFWHIWEAPLITIGGGSFMSELVDIAGGANAYAFLPDVSPQVSMEDLVRRDPDVILAGPLRARALRADPAWRRMRAVRDGRVMVVDTMLVSRASVRLGEAAVSIARLLHPAVQP